MKLRLSKGGYLKKQKRQLDLFDSHADEIYFRRVWLRELATDFTVEEYHKLCLDFKDLIPIVQVNH